MSYNILGINPFHNSSVCVLSDGEIVYFLEEDRLSKKKYEDFPLLTLLDTLNRYKIDEIALAGITPHTELITPFTQEDIFKTIVRKINNPNIKITDYSSFHHLTHASHAFFNSGFNEAISLVIDGAGSISSDPNDFSSEQDSIFEFNTSKPPILLSKSQSNTLLSPPVGLGMGDAYNFITQKLGFKHNEEGKTMGLSSYGNPNPEIPSLFKGNKTDPNYIRQTSGDPPYGTLKESISPSSNYNWHRDQTKLPDLEKDLAWRLQQDCQNIVKNYIHIIINKSKLRNIVCSGGYFLNCVSNYFLTKEFPNINFYFEPVSGDSGTSIGAAYIAWKLKNPNFKPRSQKTLYYGPQYSKEKLLEGIKKYL